MFAEALRALYGYNRWATERVLQAAAGLNPDQLLMPGTAGHGSIRDTLVHLIATQRGWLSWWNGSLTAQEAIALRPDPADFPTSPPCGRRGRRWSGRRRRSSAG